MEGEEQDEEKGKRREFRRRKVKEERDQGGKSESLTMKAITQLHSTVTCFDDLFYF